MLPRTLSLATLVSFVLLSVLLQATSPATMHPAGILFIYVLMYVIALGFLVLFLVMVFRAIHFFLPKLVKRLTVERAYYFASILALAPPVLVAMQSIGRLTVYEVALVVVFEVIACIYISKRR